MKFFKVISDQSKSKDNGVNYDIQIWHNFSKDTFILTESEFLSEEEEKYAGVLALVHNEDNTGKNITGVTQH